MKKITMTLCLLSLLAALSLAFASCDAIVAAIAAKGLDQYQKESRYGTLTITDIPAEYNGKYAFFRAMNSTIGIGGYDSFNAVENEANLPKISNGKVILSVFRSDGPATSGNDYFGQGDLKQVEIYDTPLSGSWEDSVGLCDLLAFSFTNGNATISAKNAKWWKWEGYGAVKIVNASGAPITVYIGCELGYTDSNNVTYPVPVYTGTATTGTVNFDRLQNISSGSNDTFTGVYAKMPLRITVWRYNDRSYESKSPVFFINRGETTTITFKNGNIFEIP